jgi:hypothetical protein
VANTQDETVAADPAVVTRVVAHDLVEEEVRNWGKRDGGSWVTVANLFNRISRKNASCIDGFGV